MTKQTSLLSKTLVISVIILFINISFASSENIIINDKTSKSIKNYNFDDKIYINGDDEFTPENGVSGGNGTKDDPYIIKNFYISGTGSYAISIINTRAHFIIRNCTANECFKAIVLLNVENGTLVNCRTLANCYGIYAEECKYINVINCTANYNEGYGIKIVGDHCYVTECYCSYNNDFYRFPYGFGIYLSGSNNTVFDCISIEHISADFMVLNGVNNVIDRVICRKIEEYGGVIEIENVHHSSVMNSESLVSRIEITGSSEIDIENNRVKILSIGSCQNFIIENNLVKDLSIGFCQNVIINKNNISSLGLRFSENINVNNNNIGKFYFSMFNRDVKIEYNNIWSKKFTFIRFSRQIELNANYWKLWWGFGSMIIFGFPRIYLDRNPVHEPYIIDIV